jgi:hypothetical protein
MTANSDDGMIIFALLATIGNIVNWWLTRRRKGDRWP